MRSVFKYPITFAEITPIELPVGAKPLYFNVQEYNKPFVWVEIDTIQKIAQTWNFYMRGTGHEVPEGAGYLGSCLDGPFVWHLWYESPKSRNDALR